MNFTTTNHVRKFLREQGIEFRGYYETYRLQDGRLVTFKDRDGFSQVTMNRTERCTMVEIDEAAL